MGVLRHRREYFASYPDRVLVGRLRAVRKGSLNLSLSWKSPQEGAAVTYDARTHRFGISGVGFEAQVEVRLVGGTLTNKGADGIRIEGVNEVALILTVFPRGDVCGWGAFECLKREGSSGALPEPYFGLSGPISCDVCHAGRWCQVESGDGETTVALRREAGRGSWFRRVALSIWALSLPFVSSPR